MSISKPVSPTGFDRFELHPDLVRGVRAAGFVEPRPIQVETIPAALEGADVLGLAQTGTGKTAAFALPLLDQLLDERKPGPRVLVLAPTRELATQIDAEIRLLHDVTDSAESRQAHLAEAERLGRDFARPAPIARGSRWVPPKPGIRPRLISGRPNLAVSAA